VSVGLALACRKSCIEINERSTANENWAPRKPVWPILWSDLRPQLFCALGIVLSLASSRSFVPRKWFPLCWATRHACRHFGRALIERTCPKVWPEQESATLHGSLPRAAQHLGDASTCVEGRSRFVCSRPLPLDFTPRPFSPFSSRLASRRGPQTILPIDLLAHARSRSIRRSLSQPAPDPLGLRFL
jgi:hypothetical protein